MPAPDLILPCQAFPPRSWWWTALRAEAGVLLHAGSPQGASSPRNRYEILTANGSMLLSVPLIGGRRRNKPLSETAIDYTHAWQRQHWGALYSAYGRAPFFEHYGPELESILKRHYESLLHFNLAGIAWLSGAMRLEIRFDLVDEWPAVAEGTAQHLHAPMPPYAQVFGERQGFVAGLSAIDLLMNEGPAARMYMM